MKQPRPKPGRFLARPEIDEWPLITEFAYRRDRFRRWLLASVFGALVLAVGGFPFSAVGVLLLCPLYGALAHLRCPACDSPTTLRGVTDGHCCLHCGKRLRY